MGREEAPKNVDELTVAELRSRASEAVVDADAQLAAAKHDSSTVEAMGLDKRRAVMGQRYGASFTKQATVYGIFLAVVVALFIGAKFAIDELDQGPDTIEPEAPWSKPEAEQQPTAPIDFPRNPSQ